MQIYILRHAIAVPRGTPGYPNDDRPLTEEGIAKMTEGARGIKLVCGGFDLIVTSPLIRAHDTAKIAAEAVGYDKDIIVTNYLLPGAPQRNLFSLLEKYRDTEKILLAGHEPHLGYLASSLLGINESVVEFKKGGLCRIDVDDFSLKHPGKIVYLLQPKELRMMKSE
jgi:phosphohistidine phosphatase